MKMNVCSMLNINTELDLHSSSSSSVFGFRGETPFKRVVKVNLYATLPSCSVLMVNLSSNCSVFDPRISEHKWSNTDGQSNQWRPSMSFRNCKKREGWWRRCVPLLTYIPNWVPFLFIFLLSKILGTCNQSNSMTRCNSGRLQFDLSEWPWLPLCPRYSPLSLTKAQNIYLVLRAASLSTQSSSRQANFQQAT